MKRASFAVIVVLVCAGYAIQAVGQTAFSGAGVIESTAGGFKFPDGSTQTSAGILGSLVCAAGEIAKFDGAYWVCAADNDLSAQVVELVAAVENLQTELLSTQAELSATQAALTANSVADASAHHDKYTDADAIAAVGPHSPDLTSEVNANQNKLQYVMIDDGVLNGLSGPHMILEGANVHVRSGLDSTGNLIVGHNLPSADPDFPSIRTGKDNLVVGDGHTFTANGGAVIGFQNRITGEATVVLGGEDNLAEGFRSIVIGGRYNHANNSAVVVGGMSNEAQGEMAVITGGLSNTASGTWSSVSGGENNEASGYTSSVSGGSSNIAVGDSSTVSGGTENTASGQGSSVSGGTGNIASSAYDSVSGGSLNTASGGSSSISGGHNNTASSDNSSISGGGNNEAAQSQTSVLGGNARTAGSPYCTVGDSGEDC